MEFDRGVTSAAEPPIKVLIIGSSGAVDDELARDDRFVVVDTDPQDGVARLADDPGDFDCVVVAIPNADGGLEVLSAVREATADVPVVLIDADPGMTGRALAAGATDVVRTAESVDWTESVADRVCRLVSGRADEPVRGFMGLAGLSRLALSGAGVDRLMDEAAAVLDAVLEVTYIGVHVLEPEDDRLMLRWGRGWSVEQPGDATVRTNENTQLGYTLSCARPVTVEDFETEQDFDRSGGPADDIIGAVTVTIGSPDEPFGVLAAYRTDQDPPLEDAGRFVESVAAVLSGVVDRLERQGELERYERIVETIDDGIYTLDDSFRITWVNQAAVSMLGYSRNELVGSHALMLTSEETIEEAARISQDLLRGDRTVGRLDTELRTADGERLPIETQFTMLPLGDGRYGQVGVFRDITDRKEYEGVLTALHDSTRELVRAEQATDVGRIIQETAADLLDLSTVVYLFDDDANVLKPAAAAPGAERAVEAIHPVGPNDDSPVWQVFGDQEMITLEAPAERDRPAGEWYFPLGPHGVLAAFAEAETDFDTKTNRLVGLLAANAEAALDRIDREEELRNRERERQRQNQRLKQLNRVNEIIRGIDQTLVRAETRQEIEQSVCEQLIQDERCSFVWVGTPAAGQDEIVPRAWAGPEQGYLDQITITATPDSAEPTGRAAAGRETVVVSNVADGIHDEPWRMAALARDYLSAVSVPLAYGDLFYGVLTLYADDPAAFDVISETVLGELGETIAYAINSVETKQSLLSDRSVELDLRMTDDGDLLLRMARAAECRLEFREFIPRPGGETTMVFTAPVEAAGRVGVLGDEFVAVDEIRHVTDRDEVAVFEATINTATITSTIKEYGAVLCSIAADEHEVRALVELPRDADVRAFVETLQRTVPDTELVARRDRDRTIESREEFQTDLESALTERQLEVLRAAYRNGYFEWPRQQTGEEVAGGLGISQPTFNRHLRESERKLFTLLFGDSL